VFERSPKYVEVLEQLRNDLHWNGPHDVVELKGRHNTGFGVHICSKTMRINSAQRWVAYKRKWRNHKTGLSSCLPPKLLILLCTLTLTSVLPRSMLGHHHP
jgi:hypothetical protein